MKLRPFYILLLLPLVWSCANQDYDLSKGVDQEVTLFSDELSLPLGDIAPITLKTFLDGSELGAGLSLVAEEDEDGFLVIHEEKSFYSSLVMMIAYTMLADPSAPADVAIEDVQEQPGAIVAAMEEFGFNASPQVFSIHADNPLSEQIAFSGNVNFMSAESDGTPSSSIASGSFSQVAVPAATKHEEIFRISVSNKQALNISNMTDMTMHLPASIMEKDPNGGLGTFSLKYDYKAYLSLVDDFPEQIAINLEDLSIPLGNFRVKEARIRADVASQIPITLDISDVQALVSRTDEEGNTTAVPAEDLEIVSSLNIQSGTYGKAVESPLEIIIKAVDGTIPNLAGLRLNLGVKAPTEADDNRMNVNETIAFNNIRATVWGGITFQGR